MFLGRATDFVTSGVNQVIPFVTRKNTNNKTSNQLGVINLKKSGYYNVDGSLVVSGAAGNITVTVYADGVPTDNVMNVTVAANIPTTITITDALEVKRSNFPEYAQLSLVVAQTGVTVNGTLRVEYLQ